MDWLWASLYGKQGSSGCTLQSSEQGWWHRRGLYVSLPGSSLQLFGTKAHTASSALTSQLMITMSHSGLRITITSSAHCSSLHYLALLLLHPLLCILRHTCSSW